MRNPTRLLWLAVWATLSPTAVAGTLTLSFDGPQATTVTAEDFHVSAENVPVSGLEYEELVLTRRVDADSPGLQRRTLDPGGTTATATLTSVTDGGQTTTITLTDARVVGYRAADTADERASEEIRVAYTAIAMTVSP